MRKVTPVVEDRDLVKIRLEAERAVQAVPSLKHLPYQISGAALSAGGLDKLKIILDDFFALLEQRISELPEDFSLKDAADIFGATTACELQALLYVYVDKFRPQPRFRFSSAKRAEERDYQKMLDIRVKYAASVYLMASDMKNYLTKMLK